jgi:hypothetical protein
MRRLIAVFALVAFAVPASAETGGLVINPQIGLNWSLLTDDPFGEVENNPFKQTSKVGWQFGGTLRVGGRTHFQPGFFYQYLGIELEAPAGSLPDETEVIKDTNYIHSFWVPVEIGFDIIESEALKLRLHGGGTGTFILSVSDNELGIEKDDMKRSTWGLVVGAGVDFLMLSADLSYEFGLTEVYKNDPTEAKRNALRFCAGLRF